MDFGTDGPLLPMWMVSCLRVLPSLGLSSLLLVPTGARAYESTVEDLLGSLRSFRLDSTKGKSSESYVDGHHTLLGLYWRQVAKDRVADLPPVTLMDARGRFSACGRSRSVNAYCPESNEIILSTKGMQRSQRFSKVDDHLLALTVLAHEWGHHVNHHSNRGPYSQSEEDAADWRAGRYLAWLLEQEVISVKDFTDAANLFFSIGDFHFESPHNNPKARYQAFIAGVGDEIKPGLTRGGWTMDTPETFSRVSSQGARSVTAEVYRFEIERGGQIAGNLFGALLGVVNCSIGSSSSCANALLQQGKAKPDGWYRLRTMRIDCGQRNFDIDGDGLKRQPLKADRKAQAAVIALRFCSPPELPASAANTDSPEP